MSLINYSTANYDRGGKFVHYRPISSLRDYLIISQDSAWVEHHTRQTDGSWLLREYSSEQDAVTLASIGARVTLAAIYEGIDFSETVEQSSELKIDERD